MKLSDQVWKSVAIAITIQSLTAVGLNVYAEEYLAAVFWLPAVWICLSGWNRRMKQDQELANLEWEIQALRRQLCPVCGRPAEYIAYLDPSGYGHIRIECLEGCEVPEKVTSGKVEL